MEVIKIKMFNKIRKNRTLVALFASLALIFVVIAVLELTNQTHFFHTSKMSVSGNSFTKGEPSSSSQTSDNSTPSTNTNSDSQKISEKSNSGSSTASTILTEPSGNFVSNHHPNLSGSPAPNTISSVCTTSPRASCTITFTKDGVTKKLDAQTTDQGGSAYWNWKVQDIGLSEGSWKIQAIATLNNQTKTSDDALSLVVAQ